MSPDDNAPDEVPAASDHGELADAAAAPDRVGHDMTRPATDVPHQDRDEPSGAGAAADTFTQLVATVHALTRRFPDHNGPFERVTRLLEEAGELAQQVNHAEGTGVKVAKHGPFDRAKLVKEVEDVLRTALGIAVHYNVIDDVRAGIADHYAQHVALGLVGDASPGPATGGQHGGC
ncbi:hypothetical protein [Actinoplanes sp. HUAS TT8]|uniref:hypothetical protein n=1 Tax=Actinoplanes sp. HUAS TT8 TaxID=3447453 RepID=UPI003F521CE8